MSLQPRRNNSNNSDDVEALEPIDLLPVQGAQSIHPYFAEQQNPILHYWHILRKRKWVVLATFCHCFCPLSNCNPECDTLVPGNIESAIFPENPNVLGFKDMENSSPDYEYESRPLETQVAILRSDALALKVIEAMRLYQDLDSRR